MDSSPDSRRQAADLRTLQLLWGALVVGVAMAAGIFGGLTITGLGPAEADNAALFFYLNAAVNITAIIVAFGVQRRLVDQLPNRGTYAEVVAAVRTAGILSLAVLEGSALLACIFAFLTGEMINLLFVVPFFGFAFLFFPTAVRFAALLDVAQRG